MELSVLTLKDYLAESGEVSLVINFQITKPFSSIFMLYVFYKNGMSLKKKLRQILWFKKRIKKKIELIPKIINNVVNSTVLQNIVTAIKRLMN